MIRWNLIPDFAIGGIGKAGVYLFFVLSAFLLTLPFLTNSRERIMSKQFWRHYAIRRVLRIWPLYILVLTISAVTSYTASVYSWPFVGLPYQMSPGVFFDHLTLQRGDWVLWSIPVEFKFYFILPIVALFFVFVLNKRWLPIVIVSAVLVAMSLWLWPSPEIIRDEVRLRFYLTLFFMGQMIAVLHWHLHRQPNLQKRLRPFMEVLALFCLLGVIATMTPVAAWLIGADSLPFDTFTKSFLLYGFLWGGFVLGLINGTGYLAWFFSTSVMRYIGAISFSLYLWHMGIIRLLRHIEIGSPLASAWISVFVVIVFSALSYRFFEKPLMRIRV